VDGSIPDDNPFVVQANAYHCAMQGGQVPEEVGAGGICAEIFAFELRNPSRVAVDPTETNKTKFIRSDLGFVVTWEELDPAGTDYSFPEREASCAMHSTAVCYNSNSDSNVVDPIHFYLHYKDGSAGRVAVAATTFVPKTIGWPSEYTFLTSDFIFQEIYSQTKNTECQATALAPQSYQSTEHYVLYIDSQQR
jgi:hypothetical protein